MNVVEDSAGVKGQPDANSRKLIDGTVPLWLSFDVLHNDTERRLVVQQLPKESDWLIGRSTSVQPGDNNIPKLLNKVNVLRHGNFEYSFAKWSKGLQEAHKSWKEMNPDYKIRYFNLNHCREYLKMYFHPDFLRAFDCIETYAGKVDLFGFLVVYREGGWYSDWEEVCLVEDLLDKLGSDNNTTFFATKEQSGSSEVVRKGQKMQASFFGASPQHPIIAETIKEKLHQGQRTYCGGEENSFIPTGSEAFEKGYARATKLFENLESSTKLGVFVAPNFSYKDQKINLHKCTGCSEEQSWFYTDVDRQQQPLHATNNPIWLSFDAVVDGTIRNVFTESIPQESDWLIGESTSSVQPAGDSIPKLINKVNVLRHGSFEGTFAKWSTGLKDAHNSWKKMNPDYKIRYFSLQHCREYLKRYFHPDFLRAFDCIEAFAGKVDFFGFLVVYREGGWYSDWKEVCLVDGLLDNLASGSTTFFATKDHGHSGLVGKGYIQAAFFGAAPRHPIMAETIKEILNNVKRSYYGADSLVPTGPGAFGKGYSRATKTSPVILDGAKVGVFRSPYFYFQDKKINLHKCKGCGEGQSWSQGNNYNQKYSSKEYYCPDVSSLFKTQTHEQVELNRNDTASI